MQHKTGMVSHMLKHRALLKSFGILTALAIAIAVITILPTSTTTTNTAEAQIDDICDRSQVVQDVIIAATTETVCGAVNTEVLQGITRLHFRNLNITSFKAGDMAGLDGLTWLNLAENQLTSLPDDFFDDLDSLETFIMFNNPITELGNDFFDGLTNKDNMKLIQFEGSKLERIGANTFDGFTALEALHLEANNLKSIPAGAFDDLAAMQKLNFDHNEITSLPSGLFDKMTDLRVLQIHHNNLSSLPSGIFDENDEMMVLDASFNSISSLPPNLLTNNTKLQFLNLSDNRITSLEGVGLDRLINVIELHISNNRLSKLPDDYVDAFLSTINERFHGHQTEGFCLMELYMGGNPFSAAWQRSGKFNDFLSTYGRYNIRGDSGRCNVSFRLIGYRGPSDSIYDGASYDDFLINPNKIDALGLAGIDMSHTVAAEDKSSWEVLLDDFTSQANSPFEEMFIFSFGWDGLTIDNEMLNKLPVQLESISVKDAKFANDISSADGEGFDRFDALRRDDDYNRINKRGELGSQGDVSIGKRDHVRVAQLSWAYLPIENRSREAVSWFGVQQDGLQSLTLDNVGLTGSGAAVLGKLPAEKMRWLEVRNNPRLTSIHSDIKTFTGLRGLQMEHNGIESVGADTFDGFDELFYLGLGNNKISTFEAGVFGTLDEAGEIEEGFPKLQVLMLNDNEISTMPAGALTGLERLENLQLQNNELATLPDDSSAMSSAIRQNGRSTGHPPRRSLRRACPGSNTRWSR